MFFLYIETIKNKNMKTTTATAEVLNDLIQINNDRIEGYEKGRQELKDGDADLKSLFLNMIGESQKYKMALATEVSALGEDIETGTTNSGKIYRVWMDVKAMFTGNDRQTVLNNCEFGEDAAQNAYKMALESEDLPANIRELISDQKASLRTSHDEIKRLRDARA
ncbi:hypothetical protein D3C85_1254680 [compost metagenome]